MTEKLKVLDLFSGIGGFSLGLDRAGGFETVAFCEIEPFPRRVLAKHWPEVPCYEDVTKLTGDILKRDGISVDVITGGFPCQDISVAGKQAGIGEGTRSGLWSEIVRLIGELAPRYVIVENVAALLSGPSQQRGGWFGSILGDLAECGYDAEWENIPAAALGAPHRRERVWIVAYPINAERRSVGRACDRLEIGQNGIPQRKKGSGGFEGCGEYVADADDQGLQGRTQTGNPSGIGSGSNQFFERCSHLPRAAWLPEPDVGRVANGVPQRVDRLKGLGNAVVPQIPELIGRAIMQAEVKP
jgi:DNA (cytosine-5)-methyltransferase 1